MTIAMLGLAGIPATAGFIGKFYLIDAAVDGGYTWLGIVIVIGSMISLAYYLRVVAAMWMQAPEPRRRAAVAPRRRPARCSPAARPTPTRPARSPRCGSSRSSSAPRRSFFGIVPSPLFDLAVQAGRRADEPRVARRRVAQRATWGGRSGRRRAPTMGS